MSTPSAPTPPAPTPGTCVEVDVDFSEAANGTVLSRGDYLSNEFAPFGLMLKTSGGYGDLPRVFDTSIYVISNLVTPILEPRMNAAVLRVLASEREANPMNPAIVAPRLAMP
jgi:hypothetical protein